MKPNLCGSKRKTLLSGNTQIKDIHYTGTKRNFKIQKGTKPKKLHVEVTSQKSLNIDRLIIEEEVRTLVTIEVCMDLFKNPSLIFPPIDTKENQSITNRNNIFSSLAGRKSNQIGGDAIMTSSITSTQSREKDFNRKSHKKIRVKDSIVLFSNFILNAPFSMDRCHEISDSEKEAAQVNRILQYCEEQNISIDTYFDKKMYLYHFP